ncbi:putative transcriptional regulator of pyridoxine metabolism [Paramagnetospirillum magnetotacticum MS-1]|uniref:Putative transcriptional regulator of pyridoxine metabolism n=1 Tax=Paramagnetospirillum magnetotacticum MS-1 TaxID=272627 RepID=A0A0C2UEG7_PARME|nr:PLP-dependent aminotransferase family protein [Paramagnetospirillum magnetotacticum]KIL99897.1 putative transcriptional regulator of pyridoxine metabolism [Paramagnetospirillum magnetotacticum MS-1]
MPLTLALPDGDHPLHRRLYLGLRDAILDGRLGEGSALPSSRALALHLGLARNTVLAAYDQLAAEGFTEARRGSATRVSARQRPVGAPSADAAAPPSALPSRTVEWSAAPPPTQGRDPSRPFAPGVPDLAAFPHAEWRRVLGRLWRRAPVELMCGIDPLGYLPLRRAIAAHLGRHRAVRCTADQVMIVGGSQQALDLVARVLLEPGDRVLVEDPCYGGQAGVLRAAGAVGIPVAVDAEGFDPERAERICPQSKMAFVTPSHQFPTGATMPLPRRLALIDWAARKGGWIIEDDYDSDFRHAGPPTASLQGLDRAGRTVYLGTFSKSMFPGLRLGWLVLPPPLIPAFVTARRVADMAPAGLTQAAMAAFMEEGHFGAHLRRMRAVYGKRRRDLLAAAARILGPHLPVTAGEAGLHAILWLPEGTDDIRAAEAARAQGLAPTPLSVHCVTKGPPGLILGYGNLAGWSLIEALTRLESAIIPLIQHA